MDIKEKVIGVLRDENPQIAGHEEDNLLELGLIDSFEIVNIITALEDTFDIIIDPELVIPENFENVCCIVKLINSIIH